MNPLNKVFSIIETIVSNQGKGLTYSEIVAALELPKSSVHRILKDLIQLGYLTFNPETKRYFGSLRLASLGAEVMSHFQLRDHIRPHLLELHRETDHTTNLGILDGTMGVFVDKIESKDFGIKLFSEMTTYENVLMGLLFGSQKSSSSIEEEATKIIDFVGLTLKKDVPAEDLTIIEQKRVEIARALATKPELLMLDEVMAGLNTAEVSSALKLIRKINRMGITIILIEHIMHAIMGVSQRIIVLHYGRKIAEGTPKEITSDEQVIELYLGE